MLQLILKLKLESQNPLKNWINMKDTPIKNKSFDNGDQMGQSSLFRTMLILSGLKG